MIVINNNNNKGKNKYINSKLKLFLFEVLMMLDNGCIVMYVCVWMYAKMGMKAQKEFF